MYCEARTSTGLGCDSLGIEQCNRCQQLPVEYIVHRLADVYVSNAIAMGAIKARVDADKYKHGLTKPNHPVPAIQYDVMFGKWGVEICRVPGDWNDYSQLCETVAFWQRS